MLCDQVTGLRGQVAETKSGMFLRHLSGPKRPSKWKDTDKTRDNRKEIFSPLLLPFQLGLQKLEHKQGISEVRCFPLESLNVVIHSAHGHYI